MIPPLPLQPPLPKALLHSSLSLSLSLGPLSFSILHRNAAAETKKRNPRQTSRNHTQDATSDQPQPQPQPQPKNHHLVPTPPPPAPPLPLPYPPRRLQCRSSSGHSRRDRRGAEAGASAERAGLLVGGGDGGGRLGGRGQPESAAGAAEEVHQLRDAEAGHGPLHDGRGVVLQLPRRDGEPLQPGLRGHHLLREEH